MKEKICYLILVLFVGSLFCLPAKSTKAASVVSSDTFRLYTSSAHVGLNTKVSSVSGTTPVVSTGGTTPIISIGSIPFKNISTAGHAYQNQNTTGSAAKLTTGRTIGITGPITWTSPTFDGSGNVTAAATITSQTGTGSKLVTDASPTITTPTITTNGWTAVSFTNSWADYGSPFETAAYSLDPYGNVHVRGSIKSGASGQSAFTLPVGMRPSAYFDVPSITGGATMGIVEVGSDGSVTPIGATVGVQTEIKLYFKP
jgi:hypothetical protein